MGENKGWGLRQSSNECMKIIDQSRSLLFIPSFSIARLRWVGYSVGHYCTSLWMSVSCSQYEIYRLHEICPSSSRSTGEVKLFLIYENLSSLMLSFIGALQNKMLQIALSSTLKRCSFITILQQLPFLKSCFLQHPRTRKVLWISKGC